MCLDFWDVIKGHRGGVTELRQRGGNVGGRMQGVFP